ncbi:TolC family protein [Prosthecochloris sp. SCSIO W1101]|uniref:TolC family protein n=1 Tax=Prosthecochloris sp. SCSIO W1101 TaxID=2992242 RepID=UPI00223D9803|nr:TolC family protein [Prosthecochloris sp. SCSIO W1101]UZJ40337.1 TolC family protein [Prosthecochloris sp. SCSIO W1101]
MSNMILFNGFARYVTTVFSCCIFFLFLIFPASKLSHAEPLTREAFVTLLQNTHPIFEKERLTSAIEQAEQQSNLGEVDWNLSSSLTWSREESTIAVFSPDLTNALSLETGVNKQFWDTGGRLSATYSLSRTSSSFEAAPLFSYPERFYENSIELQYSQPLLRNWGGKLTRLEYDLKAYDVDVAVIQAEENIEDFLAESISKYLDWVYLEEQKRIIERRLQLSRKEYERAKSKFNAFLVDSVDVIRAQDALNTWAQNLGLVDSQLSALKAELSILVQASTILTGTPDFNLYDLRFPRSLASARAKLQDSSRVLKIFELREEQLDVGATGVRETGKPDLSLIAAVTAKNAEENGWDSFNLEKKDAAIGLQLSLPIENRTAKANYQRNRLQVLQLEKEREDVFLSLDASLSSLHAQMMRLNGVLKLNREQIESARLRTVEEIKIYEQGRGDLTFVIMSRDNEESAKLTYAENALNYQKLWLQYQALMDELYEEEQGARSSALRAQE